MASDEEVGSGRIVDLMAQLKNLFPCPVEQKGAQAGLSYMRRKHPPNLRSLMPLGTGEAGLSSKRMCARIAAGAT